MKDHNYFKIDTNLKSTQFFQIGYRLLHPSEPYFTTDFLSGTVRSRKPLDYEKSKEWRFYVQASDMGVPSKSSPSPALVGKFEFYNFFLCNFDF